MRNARSDSVAHAPDGTGIVLARGARAVAVPMRAILWEMPGITVKMLTIRVAHDSLIRQSGDFVSIISWEIRSRSRARSAGGDYREIAR